MNRRKAWATAIFIGWAATTIVIWLLTASDPTKSATLIIEQAALIAAIPSVLVGGPVVAVALRFASQQDIRPARLRGWALGLGVLIVILAAALVAGWSVSYLTVVIVLVVATAEVELALRLLRVRSLARPWPAGPQRSG